MIDSFGVYGNYLHYGLVIIFMGSALLSFLFFWKKGRLDMDEDPKFQMMKDDLNDNRF